MRVIFKKGSNFPRHFQVICDALRIDKPRYMTLMRLADWCSHGRDWLDQFENANTKDRNMNYDSHYEGIFTSLQIKLIISRAQKLGFRDHEIPDVLQEVAIEWLGFQYDLKKNTCQDENAVLIAVADNRLCKLIRGAERDKARIDAIAPTVPQTCDFSETELAVDVRETLDTMNSPDRTVGYMLMAGYSKNQIAYKMCRDWHVVNRACERIRKHFIASGLEGWVTP